MDWNLLNTVVLSYIPHGHCYLWKSELVALHAASDAFIALAYFSIPCTLGYFVYKRKDLPYPWVFALFGVFIVSCGITHLLDYALPTTLESIVMAEIGVCDKVKPNLYHR